MEIIVQACRHAARSVARTRAHAHAYTHAHKHPHAHAPTCARVHAGTRAHTHRGNSTTGHAAVYLPGVDPIDTREASLALEVGGLGAQAGSGQKRHEPVGHVDVRVDDSPSLPKCSAAVCVASFASWHAPGPSCRGAAKPRRRGFTACAPPATQRHASG